MHERCRMLRQRMQTSSHLAGQDGGTHCTISCRVPPTLRDENFPSPSLCPSCISTQEGEMERALKTARAHPPQHRGRLSRGTANLPLTVVLGGQTRWSPATIVTKTFIPSGQVA